MQAGSAARFVRLLMLFVEVWDGFDYWLQA